MNARAVASGVLGVAASIAFAVGVAFVAVWAIDGGGVTSSVPELAAGVGALMSGALLVLARRHVLAREAPHE